MFCGHRRRFSGKDAAIDRSEHAETELTVSNSATESESIFTRCLAICIQRLENGNVPRSSPTPRALYLIIIRLCDGDQAGVMTSF